MKTKLLSFLLFCFTFLDVNAQSSNWLSAKNEGGAYDDRGTSITKDVDGNVYVTGYFESDTVIFGSDTLINTGSLNYDVFIVKYDPSGNVIWAVSAGGTGFDYSNSICVDTNMNVFITGNFRSPSITFGSITLNNSSAGGTSYDVYIAKYNSSGMAIWASRAGGSNDEESNSISVDQRGNTFITGKFTSTSISFGGTTLTNALTSNADLFVVKYDPAGVVKWAKRAGGTFGDYGNSICTDNGNNVYVTGSFGSTSITFGSTNLTNTTTNGKLDIYIVKYDSLGAVLWAKSTGGTNDDVSNSITTDNFGTFFISGYFQSSTILFGATTLNNAGIYDAFIVQYFQSNGNVTWASQLVQVHV